MALPEIKLEISDLIRKLLEERGIREDEIVQVIQNAEATGNKLYQSEPGRYLAKLRIAKATFYVEYSSNGEKFTVHTAYSHMAEIEE